MSRIGKCNCGGELRLNVLAIRVKGILKHTAFCEKCLKEYPVEMVGKSRFYTKKIIGGGGE